MRPREGGAHLLGRFESALQLPAMANLTSVVKALEQERNGLARNIEAAAVRSTGQPLVQFLFPLLPNFSHSGFGGNMKRFALLTLIMGLLAVAFPQAGMGGADPEIDAIRAVADAYLSADPVRLYDAFIPSMNLYTTDEKEALRTISFAEYLQRVSANANAAREERRSSIELVDRTGNVAIVKIATIRPQAEVTDYLSLVRIEKRWKVVNKTFFVDLATHPLLRPRLRYKRWRQTSRAQSRIITDSTS
jgi:hypothetical protein